MAFWWPLLVLGLAYVICRFLLLLIPPNVPSIDVDASDVLDDGSQTKENSYIYIPRKGRAAQSDKVQCYEPATMKYLGYFPALTPDEAQMFTLSNERKLDKLILILFGVLFLISLIGAIGSCRNYQDWDMLDVVKDGLKKNKNLSSSFIVKSGTYFHEAF